MARRRALLMISVFFSGLVAGPIIYGAVSSVFWSRTADGNDAERVARWLYTRTPLDRGLDLHRESLMVTRCDESLFAFSRPGDIVLQSALANYHRELLRGRYDALAVGSLASLPAPLLGGIDGCIGGSPASPLCLAYVGHVVAAATAVPPSLETTWKADAFKQIETAVCTAARK